MSTPSPTPARDWAAYNKALIERGSLTVWIDADALAQWAAVRDPKRIGRPFVYSDAAIQLILSLREMYHLPLRAAQGFATSIFRMLGVDLRVPHYATLSRRAATVAVDLGATAAAGPRILLLDSTGLKVYGEGEWKVRAHGYSKRRTWRKLHIALDAETQQIVACTTTENGVSDASQVDPLLDAVGGEIAQVKADGAFDQAAVYAAVAARQAVPVIPPRRGAKIHRHGNCAGAPLPRDENVRGVRRYGRRRWKKQAGYHERSLVETAMYRLKQMLGGTLRHRKMETQETESRIKCRVLNRMAKLGVLAR